MQTCPAGQLAAMLCWFGVLLSGCGAREPFTYVRVSGDVTYEDGSPIPARTLVLTFLSQSRPVDPKTFPRPGIAVADKVGRFDFATSHTAGDGLVRGKHKVTLSGPNRSQLPVSIVPVEYGDPDKTPLEVDPSESPFHLKVRKPR